MNSFYCAGIVAGIFFLMKFIEMRFVQHEEQPLRILARDSLLVYVAVLLGLFLLDQLTPMVLDQMVPSDAVEVFTDVPTF